MALQSQTEQEESLQHRWQHREDPSQSPQGPGPGAQQPLLCPKGQPFPCLHGEINPDGEQEPCALPLLSVLMEGPTVIIQERHEAF